MPRTEGTQLYGSSRVTPVFTLSRYSSASHESSQLLTLTELLKLRNDRQINESKKVRQRCSRAGPCRAGVTHADLSGSAFVPIVSFFFSTPFSGLSALPCVLESSLPSASVVTVALSSRENRPDFFRACLFDCVRERGRCGVHESVGVSEIGIVRRLWTTDCMAGLCCGWWCRAGFISFWMRQRGGLRCSTSRRAEATAQRAKICLKVLYLTSGDTCVVRVRATVRTRHPQPHFPWTALPGVSAVETTTTTCRTTAPR